MAIKTLGIKVIVNGSQKAANQLGGFTGKVAGSLSLVAGQYLLLKNAVVGILQDLAPLYDSLIRSNEQLAQSILKSQTALAGNFRIIDAFGNEIEDVGEKILATEGTIRNALIQLEKETRDLVGVTSQTTTEAFNVVLGEGGRFLQGQTKIYADEVEASIALTKGLVAALGTEGLGIEQARQEFRALVQGDLRNPDAQLAKKLNIDQAAFDTARAEGELADFLAKQFEVYTEANKLASQSIEGVSSNMVDIFEIASRTAGAELRESLVSALQDVFNFITRFEDELLILAEQGGKAFKDIFIFVREILTSVSILLLPLVPIAVEIKELLLQAADGLGKIGRLLQAINSGAFLEPIERAIPQAERLFEAVSAIAKQFIKVDGLGFKGVQALASRLNGDFRDVEGALEANANQLVSLTNEAERFSAALADAELANNESTANQYRALLGEVLAGLKEQELATQDIVSADGLQIAEKEEQLAIIRQQIEELEELGVVANRITLQNNPLQEFGDTAGAIEEQLERAFDQVATQGGGQAEVFKAAVDEAAQLVGTLESIGAIDTTTAVERLRELLNDPAIRPEQRLQLEGQLIKLIEAGSKRRLDAYRAELSELELAVAQGTISSSDAVVRRADIAREQSLEQLATAQERLRQLELTGTDANAIAATRLEIQQLSAEVEKLAIDAENIRLDEAIKQAEIAAASANAEIERLTSQTNLAIQTSQAGAFATQSELQQELLQSEINANGQLQQILQQRIAAVQNAAAQAVGDRKIQLEQELNQLTTQFTNAQLAAANQADELIQLDQAISAERRAIREQELGDEQTRQRIELEQRRATGQQINQLILSQEAELQRQLAEQNRANAQARLDDARNAEQAQTADGRLAQEAELREATSARYQAELDFISAVAAETQSLTELAIARLDQENLLIRDRLSLAQAEQNIEIELARLRGDTSSASIQAEQARQSVQLAEQELNIAKEQLQLAVQISTQRAGDLQAEASARQAALQFAQAEAELISANAQLQASLRAESADNIEMQADVARDRLSIEQLTIELAIRRRKLNGESADEQADELELAELRVESAEQELGFAKERLQLAQELASLGENKGNIEIQDQLRGATADVLQNELAVVEAKQQQKDLTEETIEQETSRADPLEAQKEQLKGLQQQITLQEALSKIEQDKFKLGQSFLNNRIRELDAASALKRELEDNANIGDAERALIKDRLSGLDAVRKSESRLAREREAAVKKQARLELQALDAKFKAEQIQLKLQLEAAELQSKIANLSGEQQGPSPQELIARARLEASEATFEAERSRLRSSLGDEVFAAERETARAADRSGSNVRRRSDADSFLDESALAPIGLGLQNFTNAAKQTFAELTQLADATKQQLPVPGNIFSAAANISSPASDIPSITNNFNSPLINASVARSLGV